MTVTPIWIPDADRLARSRLARFMHSLKLDDYDALRAFALRAPEAYWRAAFDDLGFGFRHPFEKVLDLSRGPAWPDWFAGGQLNFTDLVLDGRGAAADDPAIHAWSETGASRVLSRGDLRSEVARAMSRLAALSVGRGDRVALLLPNIPEAAIVMIAIARMGAIVVPLYSGFGADPITARIEAADARLLISCDGYIRDGKRIDLADTLGAIMARCPALRLARIAVLDAPAAPAARTVDWAALPDDTEVEAPSLAPDTPWMVMFTSGTTGRPKGTVHTHAGFPLRVAHDTAYYFDFDRGDRFFWPSDMGWMIGPLSVCAPLILGGSLVLYNGGPATPDAAQILRIAGQAGTTHLGTAPTLLRMVATRFPELPAGISPDLKVIMTAGEVIDEPTFRWAHRNIGRGRTPIINYTGGTEVSGGILSNVVTRPIYPFGFNAIVADVDAAIMDGDDAAPDGTVGELVLRRPMLGMTRGLWQDDARYLESYWQARPGMWSHGDLVVRRQADLWELRGRADDVLKLAGRRVGPSEIEEAALAAGGIAAAAAIGLPDPTAGQAVLLLVVPRDAAEAADPDFSGRLREAIGARLGPGLRPRQILAVPDLPRTRNAKILRRVARNVVLGEALGDLSSLENPSAIDALRAAAQHAGLLPAPCDTPDHRP